MEQFYVIGAKQKDQYFNDWELYESGLILQVTPAKKTAEPCIAYKSSIDNCPDIDPSHSFTAGAIMNNHLYVGTPTEVIIFHLPDFRLKKRFSLPCFNDIHHVKPLTDGTILIVNTGLDMVVKLSSEGEILNEWSVTEEKTWNKFSPFIDYRKIPTTKPHKSHPNYAFTIGEEIWTTRCLQKDAICLTEKKRIEIGRELIHDGVVFEDKIYFTQVDGCIVTVNIHSLEVEKVFNLRTMTNTRHPLGWCRGLKVLNQHQVIVGFTRIRPSRKMNSDGTITYEGQIGFSPTRIACYDLQKEILLWEQNLEKFDMNAIYSIHHINENSHLLNTQKYNSNK